MSTRSLILAPLLVMVLLTFLIGGTAYQQTLSWKNGVDRVSNNISQLVILNNIHWGLRKIQRDLPKQPEQAETTWQEMRQEVLVLLKLQQLETKEQPESLVRVLQSMLTTNHPNPELVKALIQSDFLSINLEQVEQLKTLQKDAEHVTQLVTLSLIILGLVLTGMTAYDLDRLFQQLVHSRDMNIRLQEEERHRIAQDLHDGVVQELIDIKRNYSPTKVDSVIHNLRRVCHNLKPQVLEDLGLSAALEFLADDLRQSGVQQVQLLLDEDGLNRLPKQYELPLFRVIQELCSNIKHHAQASQAKITVAYNPQEGPMLSGFVSDNGQGFDPASPAMKGMGLPGVRERIQQVGGQLKIDSQPGQGSKFQFLIPVKSNVKRPLPV